MKSKGATRHSDATACATHTLGSISVPKFLASPLCERTGLLLLSILVVNLTNYYYERHHHYPFNIHRHTCDHGCDIQLSCRSVALSKASSRTTPTHSGTHSQFQKKENPLGSMGRRLHGERLMSYVIQGMIIIVLVIVAFYLGVYVW